MNKVIVVSMIIPFAVVWQDHIARYSGKQGDDSLSDNLLEVLPLNESSE
jgi:hypothetical protein